MRVTLLNKTAGGISGGYRKYLNAMVPRIGERCDLQCIVPRSWNSASWLPLDAVSNFIEYSPSPLVRTPIDVETNISKFSPDIVFVPTERTFLYSHAPVVNLFRNLDPFIDNMRQHSVIESAKTIARRIDSRRMFSIADKIIVPTAFVSRFLTARENIQENRISVVHYGNDEMPITDSEEKSIPRFIKDGIRPGFILTAGAIRPGRGLEDAIRALAAMRNRRGRIDTLVIAGQLIPSMKRYLLALKRLCADLDISRQVIWAGHLPQHELYWCFRHCAAFLLTTRMETFCNIAVEALSNGSVIVATDSSCLPEILSNAAEYYPPGNFSQLADATTKACNIDKNERLRRASTARCRASIFNWNHTATNTIDVLKATVRDKRK